MRTEKTKRLPIFYTQVIGSLPRPRLVLDLHSRCSEMSDDRFQAVMDEMVVFAIRLQEQAGLDVVSDGEWRRVQYINEFLHRVGGFEKILRSNMPEKRNLASSPLTRCRPRSRCLPRTPSFL